MDAPDSHRSHGHDDTPLVVVVEDDVHTLALLADVALEAGWAVRTCRGIGQLQHALDHVDPALIILDDDLPDGRGGDVIRALRTDPRSAGVPVVMCTAASARRREELHERAPVVAKPFRIGDIERVLADAMRHRNGQRAPAAG
jgi:DNA-binding response OmpR family regulator